MTRARVGLAAAAAVLALAGCGSDDLAASGDAWTFTDGRDRTIELDSRPETVVAQTSVAAALQDLGVEVDAVFGPLTLPDGSVDPQASGLDPKKVTQLGDGAGDDYGTLDLEKLASLEPDLLVTYMVVPPELWYVNPATEKKVEKLVPTLAMNFHRKTLEEQIGAVGDVAEALGADLESAEATKHREAFDRAADRLRDIGERLGDRRILAASMTPDLFYAGDPSQFPDLRFYRSLGLPIIEADGAKDSYWHELSWEKSDTYEADLVLWDQRGGEAGLKQLRSDPVFNTVQAAKDDAFVPWNAVAPTSHRAYAEVMNTLADGLEKHL